MIRIPVIPVKGSFPATHHEGAEGGGGHVAEEVITEVQHVQGGQPGERLARQHVQPEGEEQSR